MLNVNHTMRNLGKGFMGSVSQFLSNIERALEASPCPWRKDVTLDKLQGEGLGSRVLG